MGRLKPPTVPQQLKARLEVLSRQVFAAAVPLDWEKTERQEFLQRVLVGVPAPTGPSYLRQQMERPLLRTDGGRRTRAADCLRQHRRFDAGWRHGTGGG